MDGIVGLLHVLGAFGFVLAHGISMPFYGPMRVAAGAPVPDQIAARYGASVTEADLVTLATPNRLMWLAAVGGIGLIVIIWLMLAKPF